MASPGVVLSVSYWAAIWSYWVAVVGILAWYRYSAFIESVYRGSCLLAKSEEDMKHFAWLTLRASDVIHDQRCAYAD